MKSSSRVLTVISTLFVALAASLVVAPPASAAVGQYQCDDGGGGITGHTSSSRCAQYYSYYPANYRWCATSISDEPMGAIDTITVNCAWGWVTPPWYIPFPPLPPADASKCAYGSAGITDAGCGAQLPLDSSENKQLLEALHNGSLVAGPGAPLGTPQNPMNLPASYTPPPNAPHVWGRATTNTETTAWVVGCGIGGGVSGLVTAVYEVVTKAEGANWGAIAAGAAAGCAGAGASAAYLLATKDQVHIWYPTNANGVANPDPSTWYKCTDFKVNAYNSAAVTSFRYPTTYPELGGQVHNFARRCVRY